MNPTDLITDFENALTEVGQPITITYQSGTSTFTATDYDEALWNTGSRTISGAGFLQPLSSKNAGADYKYLQEGKLKYDDSKLYITGSMTTAGDMRVVVGSTGSEYKVLPEGVQEFQISGTVIFKKVYVRYLTGTNYYG